MRAREDADRPLRGGEGGNRFQDRGACERDPRVAAAGRRADGGAVRIVRIEQDESRYESRLDGVTNQRDAVGEQHPLTAGQTRVTRDPPGLLHLRVLTRVQDLVSMAGQVRHL